MEDLALLERLASDPSTPLVGRCARALVDLARGGSEADAARRAGVSAATVARWRRRFQVGGVEAIVDWPRLRSQRRLSHEELTRFLELARGRSPAGLPWTSRTLAQASGLTQSTVVRLLQRHQVRLPQSGGESLPAAQSQIDPAGISDLLGLFISAGLALAALAAYRSRPVWASGHTVLNPVPVDEADDYGLRSVHGPLLAAIEAFARVSTASMPIDVMAARSRRFLDRIDAAAPAHLDVLLVVSERHDGTVLPLRWLAKRPRYRVVQAADRTDWLASLARCVDPVSRPPAGCQHRVATSLALRMAIETSLARPPIPSTPFTWVRPLAFCEVSDGPCT